MSVAAPAAGTVSAIRSQSFGDFKIEIRVDEHLCYYLAHLDVEPGIQGGSQVKAGQVIGRASARSWLDLGAYDSRIRLKGFIHADRYPISTLQSISPLALFAEPLKSRLDAKVAREATLWRLSRALRQRRAFTSASWPRLGWGSPPKVSGSH